MSNTIILWLVIGMVALITDILTSSFLFVWFTAGAIASIVVEIFDYSFIAQVIVFVITSGIFMVIGYPIAKKTIKKSVKYTPTREETYIGKELTVDEDISDVGSVRVDGVYWNAINNGGMIRKGDRVKIINLKGNKIIIEKI